MAAGLPRGAGSGVSELGRLAAPGPPGSAAPAAVRAGWTAGRVIALVAGGILILVFVLLLGGAALDWAARAQGAGTQILRWTVRSGD